MSDHKSNLILIGGGGFALEIYSYLFDEIAKQAIKNIKIKGVLDKTSDCELCIKHPEIKYLGDINSYTPIKEDVALIAIGNASGRRNLASQIKNLSLPLYSFIHSSACISSTAQIGKGVFIGPHCIVSAHSSICNNVALNVYCGVGHGATINQHSVMSPYSVINGDCELGEAVFLGSRVTLYPKIKIGSFSLIDSGCILREDIKEFSLVSQRVEQKIFDNRILRNQLSVKNQ
jgi:sugar O-acyltransferase (sialic acid O-acetyltransferase NeuD family)